MGLLNFLPKEEQYFDLFVQMTLYICDAARELKGMLADKNHNYQEYSQRIKGLEHACDELTHTVSTKLNKSFITPFDSVGVIDPNTGSPARVGDGLESVAIDPSSGKLYVVYESSTMFTKNLNQSAGAWDDEILLVTSSDGEHLSQPAKVTDWYYPFSENGRLSNIPVAAADRSNGRFRDRLYVVWTAARRGRPPTKGQRTSPSMICSG